LLLGLIRLHCIFGSLSYTLFCTRCCRGFFHIYTAFWAVGVTGGFTLAEIRWKKRVSWTHPPSLTLQLINPFYGWTSRLRLFLRKYLSIISVCFSIIPTLTSFVWGLTLDRFRMLPMEVPRIQNTCMCGDPRTFGKQRYRRNIDM